MKAYTKPRLTAHGSIETLTRSHTGAPWGKVNVGPDRWGHRGRGRMESIDGPPHPGG